MARRPLEASEKINSIYLSTIFLGSGMHLPEGRVVFKGAVAQQLRIFIDIAQKVTLSI